MHDYNHCVTVTLCRKDIDVVEQLCIQVMMVHVRCNCCVVIKLFALEWRVFKFKLHALQLWVDACLLIMSSSGEYWTFSVKHGNFLLCLGRWMRIDLWFRNISEIIIFRACLQNYNAYLVLKRLGEVWLRAHLFLALEFPIIIILTNRIIPFCHVFLWIVCDVNNFFLRRLKRSIQNGVRRK